jgi:hypothetical protein
MGCKYIIEGYTNEGNKFRPSDWIDRVASMMATYEAQRLVYSDYLHPEQYQGNKCLILNTKLEQENKGMYDYVMEFVKSNDLKYSEVCEIIAAELGS